MTDNQQTVVKVTLLTGRSICILTDKETLEAISDWETRTDVLLNKKQSSPPSEAKGLLTEVRDLVRNRNAFAIDANFDFNAIKNIISTGAALLKRSAENSVQPGAKKARIIEEEEEIEEVKQGEQDYVPGKKASSEAEDDLSGLDDELEEPEGKNPVDIAERAKPFLGYNTEWRTGFPYFRDEKRKTQKEKPNWEPCRVDINIKEKKNDFFADCGECRSLDEFEQRYKEQHDVKRANKLRLWVFLAANMKHAKKLGDSRQEAYWINRIIKLEPGLLIAYLYYPFYVKTMIDDIADYMSEHFKEHPDKWLKLYGHYFIKPVNAYKQKRTKAGRAILDARIDGRAGPREEKTKDVMKREADEAKKAAAASKETLTA
ncbi:hypothetical protein HDV00_000968 [Rhizophlyctis rosea]|nr:hypothetical protein HDV00_000968 [Rhizophlyctis rosea]